MASRTPQDLTHDRKLAGELRRVTQGRMDALERLLAHPEVTPDSWLNNNIHNVLDGICLCRDAAVQQQMLARFTKKYPAGHACWNEHIFSAFRGTPATVDWFVAQGASLRTRDAAQPGGRGLMVHAILRGGENAEALVRHRLAIDPELSQDDLHQAWGASVLAPNAAMMALMITLGVHPSTPLNAGSPPGFEGTPGNTAPWSLMSHWRSYGGDAEKEACFKVLDEHGGIDLNQEDGLGRTLEHVMANTHSHGGRCLDLFLGWQQQWVKARMEAAVGEGQTRKGPSPRL